jgi:hypothetical protein
MQQYEVQVCNVPLSKEQEPGLNTTSRGNKRASREQKSPTSDYMEQGISTWCSILSDNRIVLSDVFIKCGNSTFYACARWRKVKLP